MTKVSEIRPFVLFTALVMALQSLVVVGMEANLVRVYGDSNGVAMAEPLSQSFMQLRPGTTVVLSVGDSKTGLHRLAAGDAEVAVVEGEASQEEIEDASRKGRKLVASEIGRMDVMIIVNRSNPVDELTVKQIADMYTGRVTSWKDVGGPDIPIVCYLPLLPNSATVQWWKSTFLDGEPLSGGTVSGVSWKGIAYLVAGPTSGEPGGIAFIRSRDLHRLARKGDAGMLKILRVRKHPQAVAELPRLGVHGRTNYPIQRPLYAYYDVNSESRLPEEFVRFLAGAAGVANASPK